MTSRDGRAEEAASSIDLLLADGHQVYREALHQELACNHGDIVVVGATASVDETVAKIAAMRPTIVVLGTQLADGPGIDVLHRTFPEPSVRFVAVGMADRATSILPMIRSGAMGYFAKSTPYSDIADAVRRAATGEPVISAQLAGLILDLFRVSDQIAVRKSAADDLDRREQTILRFIGRGYGIDEIALKIEIQRASIRIAMADVIQKTRIAHAD